MFRYKKNQVFYFFLVVFLIIIVESCLKFTIPVEYTHEPKYEGINYLVDEATIYSDTCANPNTLGLKITEVSTYWIEIYNTNQTKTVCLNDYQLRSMANNGSGINTYTLPKLLVEPQTYFIIRFAGNVANNSKDMAILNGPGFLTQNGLRSGIFELTLNNQTADFVSFCGASSGSPGSPATGTFKGCLSYQSSRSAYGSFSLDENHTDNNDAIDWTFRNIVTFGGKNDVVDEMDADGDGIPDANEQVGTTFAGMPLYTWGARVSQKDIFVFVNYMDGGEYIDDDGVLIKEGLVPFKESFEKIRTVFDNNNYKIHFDLGNTHSTTGSPILFNLSELSHEVPYAVYTDIDENAVSSDMTPNATSIILYKNRYMPINRFGIFHYGLIANLLSYRGRRADDFLGLAELPGNDFIMYLGGKPNYKDRSPIFKHNFLAKVFMHELGHNLNLRHGGDEDNNYKPNYFSIMNYGYTFDGVPLTTDGSLLNFYNRYLFMSGNNTAGTSLQKHSGTANFNMNFSTGTMPDLNENNLTEINPLGAGIGNVDWNFDGYYSNSLQYNINPGHSSSGDGLKVHKDHNDWKKLQLPFKHSIAGNGYGNLNSITSPDNSSTTRAGAELVGVEGGSPYIMDPYPEHYHVYGEDSLHK